jgi:predicted acyl esterase
MVTRLPVLLVVLLVGAGLAGCLQESQTESDAPVAQDRRVTARVGGTEEAATAVPDGDYDFSGPFSRLVTKGDLEIKAPFRVDLSSDIDGANIEMAVWLPEGEGPFPVFLFSSPYFYDVDALGGSRPVDNPGGAVQVLIEEFVPHGYAFATHSVRGMAGSGGCNDLMGPLETADVDQAVTWLGTQEWSNGRIAMTGVSYDGSTPWAAATTGNPHLATIIPISGVPDMYGLMYRNGSSETRGPLVLNALYYGIGILSGSAGHAPERALCPEALEGVALSGVAGVTGFDPTGYWQERNRKPHVEANYQGSVYSIQGLQDWNVDPSQVIPWVDDLDKMGLRTKQLLGQWGHAWPDTIGEDGQRTPMMRADWKENLLAWLDQELKGLERDTGAPVQVQDNLGRWRNEAHFPPRDADWVKLHLTPDGRLAEEAAGSESVPLMPVLMEDLPIPSTGGRQGVELQHVDFHFRAEGEDLLISGLPQVHVTVTPHGPGGYMAAYLYERQGNDLRRLGWTSMNLGYADGTDQYTPVVPGLPLKVKMEIQPMDGVVRADHDLLLRLWVYTDGDRLPTVPPNGVNLEIGHAMESVLVIPVIERSEDSYFMPPVPPEEDDDAGDDEA